MEIILQLIILSVGFVMLVKGADFFVDGACNIAERFHIPQLIIGLTIVAMGTSAPEAAVSLTAAVKGVADITVGNIVGSNIMNVLIILGLTAVILPLKVAASTVNVEIPFMILITALLFLMGMDGVVDSVDGLLLTLFFLVYLGYLCFMAVRHPEQDPGEPIRQLKLWQALAALVGGLALVLVGSDLAVDAATALARIFGLSERFIGLTIVALGTSLPELVTSITAARKGSADIAIGNIVGSNIFNILFVVGLSSLLIPVPFAAPFLRDTLVALAAALFLLLACQRNHVLSRSAGMLMPGGYAVYFLFLL